MPGNRQGVKLAILKTASLAVVRFKIFHGSAERRFRYLLKDNEPSLAVNINAPDRDIPPCHDILEIVRRIRAQRKPEKTNFVIGVVVLVLDVNFELVFFLARGKHKVIRGRLRRGGERENIVIVLNDLHRKGQASGRRTNVGPYRQPHRAGRLGNVKPEGFLIEVVVTAVRWRRPGKAHAPPRISDA